MKPVLFAGTRPYGRAENITAIYDAYPGEKKYIQVSGSNTDPAMFSGQYDVLVIDDFVAPNPCKTIMIWHGIQGGKYIGFDQPNGYLTEEKINTVDYVISASHGAIPMWKSCTGLPAEKILPLGMPRTDQYVGKRKGDGHTALADKRAYLFVPTFRWYYEPEPFKIDFGLFDDMLHDDEVLAVKMHMVDGRSLKRQYRHIVEVSQEEPSAPYLMDCDVVITDYSSILFDGYLLNKPGVLYEPYPGYTSARGMYMKYPEEYCSTKPARTEEELINLVRRADSLGITEYECLHRVADMCDGHSCRRLIKLINELNGGN